MESASNPGLQAGPGDKLKTKLRRSCEACRDFKVRCHPSEKKGERCQRCMKENRKCVFLEAKPRPKRPRKSRLRVDEMEKKIESLMSMMAPGAPVAPTPSQEDDTPFMAPDSMTQLDEVQPIRLQQPTIQQSQHPFKTPKPTSFGNHHFPTASFMIFDDLQDVISRGIVTLEKAEKSLRYFRTTAANSPFVVIPPDMSLDYLRRQKPFLLLTILAMASIDNIRLQNFLDQEIRDTLSRRVFRSGERSLDLLQGILIYLTWHHLFFEPDHQQVYQLCQLAVSMAIDLGITRRHSPSDSFNLLSVVAESNLKIASTQNTEAKRAFLGCYYLSSTLCIGLRKPNNMRYTSYTEECCQVLAAAQDADSDTLIPYFIELQKLADDINQTFDYDGHQDLTPLDPVRVELLVKMFKKRLSQLEKGFPPEVWKHNMLIMTYYHLQTFVNEVGFHKIAAPLGFSSDQSSHRKWCSSITRSEVLISCLNAAKDYLERYLSLPTEALFSASFADHAKLVYNVLILRLFATWAEDDDLSLDSSDIRKSANMLHYMELLVRKFESMTKIGCDRGLLEDYTIYLTQLFRIYENRARQGIGAANFPNSSYPDMSVMQMLPLPSHGTQLPYEPSLSTTLQSQENSEDQWADMIRGWSPSLDAQDLSTEALFA